MDEKARWLLLVSLMTVSMKPAAAFAAHCEVGPPFSYVAPYDLEECPRDIQAWMDRTNGCEHLRGEISGDKSPRDDQLNDEWFELECEYLACDYQEMVGKYKGNGVLTNILEGYKKIVFGEDEALACEEDIRPDFVQ